MNFPLHYKLLQKGISVQQLVGFSLANLLGLSIILSAFQFWQDVQPMFLGSDSFLHKGQLVVTKHISEVGYLTEDKSGFKKSDIQNIKDQSFFDDVAPFTSSNFTVYATIGTPQHGSLGTEMFFESIPDKFIDVSVEEWSCADSENEVPIILPQNYLNLYNFGYAASNGLPKVTSGVFSSIPINLLLRGDKGTKRCVGRVVGFSKRINTILVPQAWLDEQNASLSSKPAADPARLVISTADIASDSIATFLSENMLETEQGDDDAARTASFMRTVSMIVILVGGVITVLAFYVLILSIFILLHKHSVKIDNLLSLGYTVSQVSLPFRLLAFIVSFVSFAIAMPIATYVRSKYVERFVSLYDGVELPDMSSTIILGISITLIILLLNHFIIMSKVKGVWFNHFV